MNGIFHTPKRFALLLLAAFALANGPVWAAPTPVADKGGDKKEEAVWGEMPAGAKTTYIGIHGGTVPVSLLTAGDGSPMIALVGLTGSDFLNFLRTNDRLQEEPLFADNTGIYAPGAHPSDINDSPVQPANADVPTPQPTGNATQPITGNATQPMAPSEQAVLQTADNQPTELPATDPAIPSESNATLLLAGSSSGDIPVIYATGRNFERLSLVPANWAPFGLTEKALSLEGEVKVLAPPKMMPKRHTIKKKRH
ncbi:hypothetical protein [Bilophila wadsworthia]|jgi:hypothetical protein|uniref:hypothetical protein n=1 Tax=Bilophila wadsworthia TaxID=35833 RepID=UPI00242C76D2|nr:hypothetical protein [Bilophila wadsworthia]